MILAQLRSALIPFDRVERIVKLGGFVNCTAGFTNQPKVVNGASDLMADVFGDKGRHARAAVGSAGACRWALLWEVDAIIALSP